MRLSFAALLFCAVAPGSLAQLAVVNQRFLEYENGPTIAATSSFRPGEMVFLSFQIGGFKTSGEEDDHVQLSWRITAEDSANRPIAEAKEGRIELDLAPEDKKSKWMPHVRYNVQIPQFAPAGTYLIHIAVDDLIAKEHATKDVGVTVVGQPSAPAADSLTIRNLQFQRSERDTDVLPPDGSFHPGDTVWARFEIAGYKFGTKNRYSVGYGLALLDSSGKVLFEQPKAATDSEESQFFPRQFVPAILNLKLDPKIKPGTYTLRLRATDSVGSQETEGTYPFRVEP